MKATMGTIETTETPVASPAAKLGTHNSLSYLRPSQWWLRPFAWMARCQSLTVKQQWDAGVRYFDIRVKFDKGGLAKSGHGIMDYDILVSDALYLIDYYAFEAGVRAVVRLFHENSRRHPDRHADDFARLCSWAVGRFPHTRFVEGGRRHDYRAEIGDSVPTRVCYAEYYKKKLCIPWPKRWAKRHNHILHRGDNADEWSVYDFINY